MKEYKLADVYHRNNVDLTDYQKIIKKAIRSVKPDAQVLVESKRLILGWIPYVR